jgi:hypothetical protein
MNIANNWRMVLIILNLEKIVDGGTFDNLTTIIFCYFDFFVGC